MQREINFYTEERGKPIEQYTDPYPTDLFREFVLAYYSLKPRASDGSREGYLPLFPQWRSVGAHICIRAQAGGPLQRVHKWHLSNNRGSIIIYKLTAEPKRLGVPIDMEVARRSQKIEWDRSRFSARHRQSVTAKKSNCTLIKSNNATAWNPRAEATTAYSLGACHTCLRWRWVVMFSLSHCSWTAVMQDFPFRIQHNEHICYMSFVLFVIDDL